jgi:hypothetical protein
MKKLFILLLSVLSLTAVAQNKKTVAVLDPICRDNSVNVFFQQMVRGAMESSITASSEYKAYDRSAFDQIQKEQAFQRTGAVNDSQIKKMGELAGVDYVLVSEVSAYEGYLSTIIKILNVTTGEYDKSVDDYMELKPESVKNKCREMASSLFGSSPAKTSTNKKQVPAGYVDLGLPSGTLWKAENEDCGLIKYDQAVNFYGSNLPTQEQWEELKDNCLWTWTGNGYKVKGKSGESIFLPAAGWRGCGGALYSVGSNGNYWSSTPNGSEYAGYLSFVPGGVGVGGGVRCQGFSVRLVK